MIGGVALYEVLAVFSDPFLWIEDRFEDVLLVGVVLPPLFLMKPLVRSGQWLAVGGIVLFSTAAVACLLYNGTVRTSGAGFWGSWVY